MKRTLCIPLDERPCNYKLPRQQFPPEQRQKIVVPSRELLSRKKHPAKLESLWEWMEQELPRCSEAVISMDMILYGGLLPSRLHHFSTEEIDKRIRRFTDLVERNNCRVSVFALIMRTPRYNSAEEEPDYWEKWGEAIYLRSRRIHEKKTGTLSVRGAAELHKLTSFIPAEFIKDYENRRAVNFKAVRGIMELQKIPGIDRIVIPQDDSSDLGYTAMDREELFGRYSSVISYPGADETGAALLCRSALKNFARPRVEILLDGSGGADRTPNYEGIPLKESLPRQIEACGGCVANPGEETDLILAINTPDPQRREAWEQPSETPDPEFMTAIENRLESGKSVALADLRYSNGGDFSLVESLWSKKLFLRLAAYGAWNTSGNTLGTTIARLLIENQFPHGETREKNLMLHLFDDLLYQSRVRQEARQRNMLSGGSETEERETALWVNQRLRMEGEQLTGSAGYTISPPRVNGFPWKRLFEIDLTFPEH